MRCNCKSGRSVKFGLSGVAVDLQASVLRRGHHRTAARAALEIVAKRGVAPYDSTLIGTTGTVGIVSVHPSRD
ncbi:unnamed protein product [Heligmosomoides polygyrus]|uniref:PALP domain-containing protein n=1 Tax=Heligmosomoides polygyrus TaxID=6339 RepID=A0A183F4T9_HELPZ|nr:unnamed protein product [Heligmosomoides polygyrus]